jgi:drug/metabolite transporter (DMT)-like permease
VVDARSLNPAVAALVAATIAVSFSAIFIRIANDDWATIVWVRMAMAAVLVAPFAWRDLRGGSALRSPRRLGLVAASGVFLAGHFLLWTASLRYTSIAASVLLVSMHPVIVTLLSRRLLRERVPPRTLVGLAAALGGTVVTCAGDLQLNASALAGDGLALGGAVCLAGYLLIGRGVRATVGVAGYSTLVYAVVAVIAGVSAFASGSAHLPSPRVALLCLALAVVCTMGGHTVYNWALRHVRATTVSAAFLGEPPLTAVLALVLLGSRPALTTVAGGVLILAGLALILAEQTGAAGTTASVALE